MGLLATDDRIPNEKRIPTEGGGFSIIAKTDAQVNGRF